MSENMAEKPEVQSLGFLLFNCLEKYAKNVCQIDANTDKSETFESVKLRSTRLALALQQKNLNSDDVVLICSNNNLDNCIPVLATLFLGAKLANINEIPTLNTIKHLISLVKPKIIFVVDSTVSMIEKSLNSLEITSEIIIIGQSEKYQCLNDLILPHLEEKAFKPVKVNIDELAIIFFSSGTTGLQKAISHNHKSILHATYYLYSKCSKANYQNISSTLHFMTFYGFSTLALFIFSIIEGYTRVFSSNTSGKFVLDLIEKYEISLMQMLPFLTNNLTNVEDSKTFDTSSLKMLAISGTALNSKQYHRLDKMFKNAHIVFSYGMTEIGTVSEFDIRSSELMEQKLGSTGNVLPGIFVKIVDIDTENQLSSNQRGEIRIKSPTSMLGYYQADASSCFDSDGFFKTGDLGYLDEDRCLYVVDRLKETFKYLYCSIVPAIIESVLLEHPMVAEAVVFALPKGDTDLPTACVTLKQNTLVSDIDKFVTERVSNEERLPGGIFIVESLPKTPSGKIIRSKVREIVLERLS